MTIRSARILVVEDTPSLAQTYAGLFEGAGYSVDIADCGRAATERMAERNGGYDIVLLDLQLPDCDGLQWLEEAPAVAQGSSVIVVTADGSINRAIGAMRLGAYDFLVKPISPERLLTTARNAAERRVLTEEIKVVSQALNRDRFHGFIGGSNVMQAVYRAIENVADSKATVFITGESGTGKEVAAEAIHQSGKRRTRPFVAINCGAIPENLLESELFGHVKGAFTGALDNRIGAAKEADGGTLFLDEICEMELKLQVKLLRFLQTGMIQRVGSSRPEAVDVRVVCATNRDPAAEVAAGRFREDLFYRLAVIPIDLPPLRDRGDDIGRIAQAFLERFAKEEGKALPPLDDSTLQQLAGRTWPGNVRELQNAVRRAVVMSRSTSLGIADFPAEGGGAVIGEGAGVALVGETIDAGTAASAQALTAMTLEELQNWAIAEALKRHGGSLPKAARALGVSPSTLYRKKERD